MNTITDSKSLAYQYDFIYHFRKQLPKATVFYMTFIVVKYFNVYLITHYLDLEDINQDEFLKPVTFTSILRHFRLFPENILNFKLNYSAFCVFIYTLILILTGFFFVFYFIFKKAHLKSDYALYRISSSKTGISPRIKALMKFYVVFAYVIIYFSQFVIEFLGYALFNVYYPTKPHSLFEEDQLFALNKINYTLWFNKYFLCVLNSICIIIILIYFYLFMIYSSYRTSTKTFGKQIVESHKQIAVMTVIFHLQGFYSITFYFIKDHSLKLRFVLLCIILCCLLINIILQFNYHSASNSSTAFVYKCLNNVCFIASIFKVVLYLCKARKLETRYEIYKFIFEVINGYFITYLIVEYKKKISLKRFFDHLFKEKNESDHIDTTVIEYLAFVNKSNSNDKQAFELLIYNITKHQLICKCDTCYCRKYFKESLEHENYKKCDKTMLKLFKAVGEDQIVSSILNLSKKNMKIAKELFLIHVDYLTSEKEYFLSLYLCQYYLTTKKMQLDFLYGYYLYEINRLIFCKFKGRELDKEEQSNIIARNIKKISVRLSKQNKFINEQFTFHKIKSLLFLCAANLEKILFLKQIKNNNNKMTFTSNDIMSPLNKLVQYRKQFLRHLTIYFKADKRIESIEMSYLITYGLILLFEGKVSRKFANKYLPITNYELAHVDKQQLRNHYLILKLESDDRFIIQYGSVNLIEKLRYKRNELINKDFNILMPQAISDYHFAYMKSFVTQTNVKLDKYTFLLSKQMNLIRVFASIKNLPSVSHLFSIIIKISTPKDYNTDQISYYALLDEYFNFVSTTKRFEKQFVFTSKMLEVLKINFCNFFGLNIDSLSNKFQPRIKKIKNAISKTYGIARNHSLLTSVKSEEYDLYTYIVRDRKENGHKNADNDNCILDIEVDKSRTIRGIKDIEKRIDELGLEKEWNDRILDLYKRLRNTNERDEHQGSNDFKFQFELKSIGISFYYIVLIKEQMFTYRFSHDTRSFCSYTPMQGVNGDIDGSLKMSSFSPKRNPNNYRSLFHQSSYSNSSTNVQNNITNTSKSFLSITPNMNNISSSNLNNSMLNKSNFQMSNSRLHLFTNKENSTKLFDRRNTNKVNHSQQLQSSNLAYYNKTIRQYNGIMNILYYIIYCLFVAVLCLTLAIIITNFNCNNVSLSLYNVNSNAFLLKSDIYFSALAIISSCLSKDGVNLGTINVYAERIKQRANDVLTHHHQMISNVNGIIYKPQAYELYDLFYGAEAYHFLAPNWDYFPRITTLGEEVHYIYYSLLEFDVQETGRKCRVQERFYNKTYKRFPSTNSSLNEFDESTFEEEFLFYILSNVLSRITRKIDGITFKTNELLDDSTNESKLIGLILSSFIFVLAFILYFLLLCFVYSLYLKYRLNIECLFAHRPKESSLLLLISNFKVLINEFGKEECNVFEAKIKELSTLVDISHIKRQSQTQFLLNQLKNNCDRKTENTREIKRKIMAKQDQMDNEQSEYTQKQFRKIIKPMRFKVLICAIAFFFICFCVVQIIYIIISSMLFEDMVTQNKIAVNLLTRVTKLAELELYAITSVIYNNNSILEKDIKEYNSIEQYNYYNIEIDFDSDIIFTYLKGTNYAFIYYQLLIIRRNLQLFAYDKDISEVLPKIRKLENIFNEDDKFCIYMPYYYTLTQRGNRINTVVDAYNYISRYTKECRVTGFGINLKGSNAAFDLMINELCVLFSHYFLLDDDERNPNDFFSIKEFMFIDQNLQLPFKKMQNVYADILKIEVEVFYKGSYFIELLFAVSCCLLSCGVIAILIPVVKYKIEPFCNLSVEITRMLDKVMINVQEIGWIKDNTLTPGDNNNMK